MIACFAGVGFFLESASKETATARRFEGRGLFNRGNQTRCLQRGVTATTASSTTTKGKQTVINVRRAKSVLVCRDLAENHQVRFVRHRKCAFERATNTRGGPVATHQTKRTKHAQVCQARQHRGRARAAQRDRGCFADAQVPRSGNSAFATVASSDFVGTEKGRSSKSLKNFTR